MREQVFDSIVSALEALAYAEAREFHAGIGCPAGRLDLEGEQPAGDGAAQAAVHPGTTEPAADAGDVQRLGVQA